MSLNFGLIRPRTGELPALELLKKSMYNLVSTLAPSVLIGSSSYLQIKRTTIISCVTLNFGQIRPRTVELAALAHMKKFQETYNARNVVSTLGPSFLIGSSSLLQETRTCI